jgi:hypothetical protein
VTVVLSAFKSALPKLVVCSLIPAAFAALISPVLGISVFIAAFVLATVIGYPLFLLARRYSVAYWWIASFAGLLIGAGVASLMFWPSDRAEMKTTSWRGSDEHRVYTYIDGVPTRTAWNDYFIALVVLGVVGTLGGLVFWEMAKPKQQPPEGKP